MRFNPFMRKAIGVAALAVTLQGCASSDVQVPDFVEVVSLSGAPGGTTTQIQADGTLIVTTFETNDTAPVVTQQNVSTDQYAQARAVALGEIASAVVPTAEICPNYGRDSVRVVTGGLVVAQIEAACPDDAVQRVQRLVRGAIAG